jgi:hypothetical protein
MGEDKSDFYRRRADELRRVAEQTRFEDTRRQLIGIALLFERLAARIGERERERQAAD